MFRSLPIRSSRTPKSIDPSPSALPSRESWMKKNSMSTSRRREGNSRINSEDRDTICPFGSGTDSGSRISKNMPGPDLSSKGLFKSTTPTKVFGSSMPKWK